MYVLQPLTYFVKFSFFVSLNENLFFTWIQASIRRSASYLIGYLFENSKLFLDDEAPGMISTLIVLLSDSDHDTVVVVLANTSLMFLASLQSEVLIISFINTDCLGSFVKGRQLYS